MKWVLLFTGGGLGAMMRFALALWVDSRAGVAWPLGTLAVNAVGCFAIGVVATLADDHQGLGPGVRLFLIGGVLGGFTTFSTFGLETWRLVEDGRWPLAAGNAAASVAVCLAAVAIAVALTRALDR